MEKFEKVTELIQEFYKIEGKNFPNEIFAVLKKIIDFSSGYIVFSNSENIEYSYNSKISNISEIKESCLKEDLIFKHTMFGQIIITGENFSSDDKKIFKTCAAIISNIIKDFEVSKVIKMQLNALQQGYIDIKKNNQKIKEAEQVKTKFISHVSHELRTPINSILGYSELLGEEFTGTLTDKQKEFVNDIKISALHLLGMVNEILDMSKIEAGAVKLNLRKFEIVPCIKEVINIINPLLLQKKQTLKTELDNFEIKADYNKIQQILFNLLSNAIKYTPDNGEININCYKGQTNAIIKIRDNGIGIESKYLNRIFNKFEQIGEPQQNSTGLGLAITKELINIHNGEISVKSEPNKGTIFIVRIPL